MMSEYIFMSLINIINGFKHSQNLLVAAHTSSLSSPPMRQVTLMNSEVMQMVLQRLSHQLIENHKDFGNSLIMGIQPRGVNLASEIVQILSSLLPHPLAHGTIDPTF